MGVIETEDLTRRFGAVNAVQDLTISVPAGEVFGLLGPNGAGKTTVIKMLITLLRPTAGLARVAGLDVVRQATSVRRVIGYVLALILGVGVDLSQLALGTVALVVALGAALFSTFSLVIACVVKTRERFMGIGQVLTMPLCFASNAIYPLALMPGWLQAISHLNPLTYEVDALRTAMLAQGTSAYGLGVDLAVLLAVTAGLVALAGRLYPTLAE